MSDLAPTPPATLRRTVFMRTLGGPLLQGAAFGQPIAVTVILLAAPSPPAEAIWFLAGWAAGWALIWLTYATAWVRIDDIGVHRRCFLRHSYRWDEITEVGIRSEAGLYGQRHLRLRAGGHRRVLVPATGGSRANREFAGRVARAAAARGIPADVTGL